jgi:Fe-S cluster assembly scaffold protein SufB
MDQNAAKSEGRQSSKAILLDERSKAYTEPKIEIAVDDVKCSHGSSISKPRTEELFYLKSRGLSEVEARSILATAFCSEISQYLDPQSSLYKVSKELIGRIN